MDLSKIDPKHKEQEFKDGRKSLVPSGYFGKTSDKIFVIDNFLTENECAILLNAAKNLEIWKDSQYRNKYSSSEKLQNLDLNAYNILQNVAEKFKKEISIFFDTEIETYNIPISKWAIGNDQKPHADKEWADGTPAEPNYFDIGSVIYLNEEYQGGELYFTQHDFKMKPKAFSAIAFPGDMYFLHGVTTVEKTERYTIPIFWTVTKYEKEKDKTLFI